MCVSTSPHAYRNVFWWKMCGRQILIQIEMKEWRNDVWYLVTFLPSFGLASIASSILSRHRPMSHENILLGGTQRQIMELKT